MFQKSVEFPSFITWYAAVVLFPIKYRVWVIQIDLILGTFRSGVQAVLRLDDEQYRCLKDKFKKANTTDNKLFGKHKEKCRGVCVTPRWNLISSNILSLLLGENTHRL